MDPTAVSDQRMQAIRTELEHKGLILGGREHAEVFLVADPSTPSERTKWLVALRGGLLAAVGLVDKQRGAYLQYCKGVKVAQWVYVSDGFKAKHPQVAKMVCDAAAWPASKWRLLDDMHVCQTAHACRGPCAWR